MKICNCISDHGIGSMGVCPNCGGVKPLTKEQMSIMGKFSAFSNPSAPTPPAPEEGAKEERLRGIVAELFRDRWIADGISEQQLGVRISAVIDTVAEPLRREVAKAKEDAMTWARSSDGYADKAFNLEANLTRCREHCAELEAEASSAHGAFNLIQNCADTLRSRDFGGDLGPIDIRVIAMAKALDEARAECRELNEDRTRLGARRDALQARTEQLTAEVLTLREALTEAVRCENLLGGFKLGRDVLARTAESYASLVPIARAELEQARQSIEKVIDDLASNTWGPYDVTGILNEAERAKTALAGSKGRTEA